MSLLNVDIFCFLFSPSSDIWVNKWSMNQETKWQFLFYVWFFKVRRSRASSDWTLSVFRMIKFLRNHPARGETSGSVAANRTSSPANQEEKSMSRTHITTHRPPSEHLKPARSTRSLPGRTYVGARSSFSMCPASLFSHWCLTSTHLRGVSSVTSRLLMDLEDLSKRHLTTGSSCQGDSVTPYQCHPSCHAPRSSTSPLSAAPLTTVLLPVTPASSPPRCQVRCLKGVFLSHFWCKSLSCLVSWKLVKLHPTSSCSSCKPSVMHVWIFKFIILASGFQPLLQALLCSSSSSEDSEFCLFFSTTHVRFPAKKRTWNQPHTDITMGFNVCICRICHRHEENTHNRLRAVVFFFKHPMLPAH